MMIVKLFILSLYIPCVMLTTLKSANNYGPYISIWDTFNLCQGPKRVNVSKVTTELIEDRGSYVVLMNMSYLKPFRYDEIRTQISAVKGGKRTTLWTYKMKDPCKQIIFETIMHKEYNISKDCTVQKGDYYYRNNLTDLWYKFVGHSFFYGEYWVKSTVVSTTANICCVSASVQIVKAI